MVFKVALSSLKWVSGHEWSKCVHKCAYGLSFWECVLANVVDLLSRRERSVKQRGYSVEEWSWCCILSIPLSPRDLQSAVCSGLRDPACTETQASQLPSCWDAGPKVDLAVCLSPSDHHQNWFALSPSWLDLSLIWFGVLFTGFFFWQSIFSWLLFPSSVTPSSVPLWYCVVLYYLVFHFPFPFVCCSINFVLFYLSSWLMLFHR